MEPESSLPPSVLDRLKEATKWMWSLGDYTAVAKLLEPYAVQLADACAIRTGTKVLDVAAGNGNFALAAEARGGMVTASDVTPHMVDLGRARSEAAASRVEWFEADAEALPFRDEAFDVVASVFGAMFAPRPDRVAKEMFRVCRPGGLVAMANYSWNGFLGSYSRLLARYSTPLPFAIPSPFEWGDPVNVTSLFKDLASSVKCEPHELTMSFPTVDDGLSLWERTNPPTIALNTILPAERYAEFLHEARDLMGEMNQAGDRSLALTSAYLRVLAYKSDH